MHTMDAKKLFDAIRRDLFHGQLTQGQVDGINDIVDEFERRKLTDKRWLAYILATEYWETTQRMQPVSEDGGNAYFHRMYDIEGERPGVARMLGNLLPGDGILFHGRGGPQLTGRRNYQKMTELLGARFGFDFEKDPDKVLIPAVSIAIMFEGMLRADSGAGDFTGVSLENYFNATTEDWEGARKIINGTDHAADIAVIARKFYAALLAAV